MPTRVQGTVQAMNGTIDRQTVGFFLYHQEDVVYCRFRGAFTSDERKRIERAVAALDQGDEASWMERVAWLVMCATPGAQPTYVAIRLSDGWTTRAPSVDELIATFEDAGRPLPPQASTS